MYGTATQEVAETSVQARAGGRWWGYAWRVATGAAVWVVSTVVGGALLAAAGVKMPEFPAKVEPQVLFGCQALGALILAAGLIPLAQRLQGGFIARWLALASLVWVAVGVCNGIEAQVFTTLGRWDSTALVMLLPSLVFAAVVARLCPGGSGRGPVTAAGLGGRSLGQWLWRAPLAILAFPLAYYVFGMLLMAVCPYLMEYYKNGVAWLRMPDPAVVPVVQLGRSVLFLVSTLPILALWRGSRGLLMLQLGLASWVVVGAFGLVQAVWMPMALRVPHMIEILADSLAWAWMVVGLLVPKRTLSE